MSLRNTTLTFSRPSGGEFIDGFWVNQSETATVTALGSLQPLSARKMEALPEGRRNRQSFLFITDVSLNTVESQNPDKTTIGSDAFEVYSVESWQNTGLAHYEYV